MTDLPVAIAVIGVPLIGVAAGWRVRRELRRSRLRRVLDWGGRISLRNACAVKAVVDALGVDGSTVIRAFLDAGWAPHEGVEEDVIFSVVRACGADLVDVGVTVDDAVSDGGSFIVVAIRSWLCCHAWAIVDGRHSDEARWDRYVNDPYRWWLGGMRVRVLRVVPGPVGVKQCTHVTLKPGETFRTVTFYPAEGAHHESKVSPIGDTGESPIGDSCDV